MAENREPFRRELTGGAIEIVLVIDDNVASEQGALLLMREQVAVARAFADQLERIAQNWSADLEAGRTTAATKALETQRGNRG